MLKNYDTKWELKKCVKKMLKKIEVEFILSILLLINKNNQQDFENNLKKLNMIKK